MPAKKPKCGSPIYFTNHTSSVRSLCREPLGHTGVHRIVRGNGWVEWPSHPPPRTTREQIFRGTQPTEGDSRFIDAHAYAACAGDIDRETGWRNPGKKYVTVKEFCALSRLSRTTFYELKSRSVGPRITKIGRKILIRTEEMDRWMKSMEDITQ